MRASAAAGAGRVYSTTGRERTAECRRVCVHVQPTVSSSLSRASLTAPKRRNRVLLLFPPRLLEPISLAELDLRDERQATRLRMRDCVKGCKG